MTAIRKGVPGDVPPLIALWRRSAAATHTFLSPDDLVMIEPDVRQALTTLETWVTDTDGVQTGFMAMDGDTIEALFIDPARRGMGLGRMFIEHARTLRGRDARLRVDVNEQNPAAASFYEAMGFRRIGRSETDAAGRPWPLLHLESIGIDNRYASLPHRSP